MIGYKWVAVDMTTFGGYRWEVGVWERKDHIIDYKLCTPGFFHYYTSIEAAGIGFRCHVKHLYCGGAAPNLWEVEIDGVSQQEGIKSGCTTIRLLRQVTPLYIEPHQLFELTKFAYREAYSPRYLSRNGTLRAFGRGIGQVQLRWCAQNLGITGGLICKDWMPTACSVIEAAADLNFDYKTYFQQVIAGAKCPITLPPTRGNYA